MMENKTKIDLKNKSIFITGVAGFIGSNLAKRLLSTVEGVKVVGLDNMNHYYDVRLKEARLNELEQFENFSFVKGNLADKAVIESIFEQYKPEIVVNLGAQAGVRYSITNPDAYVEANLIGFYNILEACRHSYDEGHTPVEHLVYASSSSVYGSNKKVPYSTDDKVDNPVSLYKALEQYTYITVRSIIFKFIAIVAMFLMVHEQSDYVIYGGISILASSASNIFNFFHIHRYINIKPVGHYNFKKHLKAIVIFFAMSCATTIYTHLDTVMLGFIRTDADVGYYNAAVKIKTILVSIVTSLGVVLLPRASYYVEHSMMDEFYRITKKAINFVFLIATPMMIYFMLFAKEGVFFLSGDAYAGAIIPMQVIMPTLLFIGLTNIMGIQMLVPLGKEKVVLYSEIAGMIVDIILNALLIPKMASTGAAIGTLAAEIAVFIVQYVALRGIIKEAYRQVHYVAIGSSVLAGGVLAVLIKRMQWGSFMTLCASAIVFFGVYFLILTIAKESLVIEIENQLLGRIIKKK